MAEQKNTVIINGKVYDALTGDLVKVDTTADNSLANDFISKNSETANISSKSRRSLHHIAHHKPQKSITLKRIPKVKSSSIASSRSLPVEITATLTAQGQKHLAADAERYERAKKVSKSTAISKFNLNSRQAEPLVTKIHQPLPVKPAPPEHSRHHQTRTIIEDKVSSSSEDLFSTALGHANSHKQTPLKISHRKHRVAKKLGVSARTANLLAILLIVVALGGFTAYQNVPNMAMRVAISQSGVNGAAIPGFKPSGFALNRHVSSSPGQITISFRSNSDNRAFTITQSSSNWNSQTLADSYLIGKQVQKASQPDGKTVYLYGGSNATWVDGGIWYRIEGNSLLTSDQLLKIASSF